MKIAFAGDSFCMSDDFSNEAEFYQQNSNGSSLRSVSMSNQRRPSWPLLVAKKLNAEIIQLGHGGQHLFHAINVLMPNILAADVIVMCISEPYRIINNDNLPINSTWVEQITTKTGAHWNAIQIMADEHEMPVSKIIKIANASKDYYNHIFDNEIAEMAQLVYVSFIDNLMASHNKKVIWFPCFYQSFQLPTRTGQDSIYYKAMKTRITTQPAGPDTGRMYGPEDLNIYYLPASGPSINIPLNEVSELELKQQSIKDADIHHTLNNDERCNHLNDENNINMAELVLDTIEKYWRSRYASFLPEVIKIEEYFPKINFDGKALVR